MKKWLPFALGVLSFLIPLGLYLKTLAPTYIPVDSAEFTLCMHYWGVCHPPGFPFYVFLGKVFTDVFPFGSLIFKANLLTALYAAATILVLFLSLIKVGVRQGTALLVALTLAVCGAFWEYSTAADVFTFATFLLALSFLFVFIKRPFLAFVALGFSASHFYITAVLAPMFVLYFSSLNPSKDAIAPKGFLAKAWNFKWLGFRFGDVVVYASFFFLGFVGQVLMYVRMLSNPQINWEHVKNLGGLIYFLRREEFGSIFLIKNPVLTFSVIKYFKHIWVYFESLLVGFGVVLPILVPLGLVRDGLWKDKKTVLLFASFLVLVLVQLFLLSTIDPTGADNPFQINKFYLVSYVPLVILIGLATQKFIDWFFEGDATYVNFVLGAVVVVYLLSGLKTHNLSRDYFSQNMVLDALDELPGGSVAVTVSHQFYFGGLYEQMVDGNYKGVDLLYFPNEFNRDNESYRPQLFSGPVDLSFVSKVRGQNKLGNAEEYILETISRNPEREIYILQGTFEESFFAYLKPYIVPYGLWWKVTKNPFAQVDAQKNLELLDAVRSKDVKYNDFEIKQQQDDTLLYAVAYNSEAVLLAKQGKWDKALELFRKSDAVRPGNSNIKEVSDLITKIKSLTDRRAELVQNKDSESLNDLANSLFNVGDYTDCAAVYSDVLKISQQAKDFSNYASCLASSGRFEEARLNYQKALALDPNLDLAKQGLDKVNGQ